MPASYRIHKEQRLALITLSGCVTVADIQSLIEQGPKDPDFDPQLNELVDLRSVTEFALSSDEVRTFARRRVFSPESRRAFVASSPHIFGLGRMWEAYTALSDNPTAVCVFYDLPAALKWLGLDDLPR
jgi:hypothetical protein